MSNIRSFWAWSDSRAEASGTRPYKRRVSTRSSDPAFKASFRDRTGTRCRSVIWTEQEERSCCRKQHFLNQRALIFHNHSHYVTCLFSTEASHERQLTWRKLILQWRQRDRWVHSVKFAPAARLHDLGVRRHNVVQTRSQVIKTLTKTTCLTWHFLETTANVGLVLVITLMVDFDRTVTAFLHNTVVRMIFFWHILVQRVEKWQLQFTFKTFPVFVCALKPLSVFQKQMCEVYICCSWFTVCHCYIKQYQQNRLHPWSLSCFLENRWWRRNSNVSYYELFHFECVESFSLNFRDVSFHSVQLRYNTERQLWLGSGAKIDLLLSFSFVSVLWNIRVFRPSSLAYC